MLNISFRTSPEVIDLLREKGSRVVTVLQSKLTMLMFALGKYVQEEKLSASGPTTLGPKSGRLRASVNAEAATISGTRITGRVSAAGSVAFYGTYHEHGVLHPWEIVNSKKRALAFLSEGKLRFAKSVTHPPLPARRFMESSLTENATKIFETLQKAVADVVAEKD